MKLSTLVVSAFVACPAVWADSLTRRMCSCKGISPHYQQVKGYVWHFTYMREGPPSIEHHIDGLEEAEKAHNGVKEVEGIEDHPKGGKDHKTDKDTKEHKAKKGDKEQKGQKDHDDDHHKEPTPGADTIKLDPLNGEPIRSSPVHGLDPLNGEPIREPLGPARDKLNGDPIPVGKLGNNGKDIVKDGKNIVDEVKKTTPDVKDTIPSLGHDGKDAVKESKDIVHDVKKTTPDLKDISQGLGQNGKDVLPSSDSSGLIKDTKNTVDELKKTKPDVDGISQGLGQNGKDILASSDSNGLIKDTKNNVDEGKKARPEEGKDVIPSSNPTELIHGKDDHNGDLVPVSKDIVKGSKNTGNEVKKTIPEVVKGISPSQGPDSKDTTPNSNPTGLIHGKDAHIKSDNDAKLHTRGVFYFPKGYWADWLHRNGFDGHHQPPMDDSADPEFDDVTEKKDHPFKSAVPQIDDLYNPPHIELPNRKPGPAIKKSDGRHNSAVPQIDELYKPQPRNKTQLTPRAEAEPALEELEKLSGYDHAQHLQLAHGLGIKASSPGMKQQRRSLVPEIDALEREDGLSKDRIEYHSLVPEIDQLQQAADEAAPPLKESLPARLGRLVRVPYGSSSSSAPSSSPSDSRSQIVPRSEPKSRTHPHAPPPSKDSPSSSEPPHRETTHSHTYDPATNRTYYHLTYTCKEKSAPGGRCHGSFAHAPGCKRYADGAVFCYNPEVRGPDAYLYTPPRDANHDARPDEPSGKNLGMPGPMGPGYMFLPQEQRNRGRDKDPSGKTRWDAHGRGVGEGVKGDDGWWWDEAGVPGWDQARDGGGGAAKAAKEDDKNKKKKKHVAAAKAAKDHVAAAKNLGSKAKHEHEHDELKPHHGRLAAIHGDSFPRDPNRVPYLFTKHTANADGFHMRVSGEGVYTFLPPNAHAVKLPDEPYCTDQCAKLGESVQNSPGGGGPFALESACEFYKTCKNHRFEGLVGLGREEW